MIRFILQFILAVSLVNISLATDYYVHPVLGNDRNNGSSKTLAFKTLEKASSIKLLPGDRILLATGQVYLGSLRLQNVKGETSLPIIVESVSWNITDKSDAAIIDAKNLAEAILIEDCSYIRISNINVTANGYVAKDSTQEMRVGVMIRTKATKVVEGISIQNVKVYDVFFENAGYARAKNEVKTANGTERYGWGIRLMNLSEEIVMDKIVIENCEIRNVSHTGIKLTGKGRNIQNARIVNNKVMETGGPGIQMSNVRFVYVGNNEVTKSGSTNDSRKWGRGSGLWTWSASNVLIEKNKFMYANGPGDSAGAHIDFNCDNVILQYNLSAHNAGGFCEVLGNNYNCAYRYNISVNDGHRVKGEGGAFQEGKTFWLSGYQGNKERKGPVNTYFYNNTIYVDTAIAAKIAIDNRSAGVLIANNIFYIMGESSMVKGDQYKPDDDTGGKIDRTIFKNNLFLSNKAWPVDAIIRDSAPLYGDPGFIKPGGLQLEDYTPTTKGFTKRGIEIPFVPGDDFGLINGLKMNVDIVGKKVNALPGLGAIEY